MISYEVLLFSLLVFVFVLGLVIGYLTGRKGKWKEVI